MYIFYHKKQKDETTYPRLGVSPVTNHQRRQWSLGKGHAAFGKAASLSNKDPGEEYLVQLGYMG